MNIDTILKKYFPYVKYICGGVVVAMMVWLYFTLLVPDVGGPFPMRARGPLAKTEYYQLGELDAWESVIDDPAGDGDDRILAEVFLESDELPPLEFGEAPLDSPAKIRSVTQE